MNLEKTSIILKKINRLHYLINAIGEASSTETDLLKAYVIDLYEAVAMADIAQVEDLEKEEMEQKIKKQKKVEKKIKKKVHKKEAEKIEDEIEEVEDDEDDDIVEEIEMEVKEALKEIEAEEEVKGKIKETPKPKKAKTGYSNELIELFDLHESSELSDKLASAPISDLTKAMGINEKIFTVNELFGGKQDEMNNMLCALNGLDNFEEAKSVLMNSVAQKYNWTEGSKLKKAKNFIKLVKRRFK